MDQSLRPADRVPMTLRAKYYTDAGWYRHELERFFATMWLCAGRAKQLDGPGSFFTLAVGDESLIVTRGEEGTVRAFFNVCRHRGTRMCTDAQGAFPGGRIQCPYHAWTYGLDGRLIAAPGMAGAPDFRTADYPLHPAGCEEWEGLVFVRLRPEGPSLGEQLGDLVHKFDHWELGTLRRVARKTYDVRANWKLIIQNYSECVHCPLVHPALQRLSDFLSGDNDAIRPGYFGGNMKLKEQAETMTLSGKTIRAPLPRLGAEERRHVYYYAVMPNLLLSLHPDYVMTHILRPLSHDRTEIHCDFYFHPDEIAKPSFNPDDAVDFWDLTNRQDWNLSELSQLGIGSRSYTPGPYSPREMLLHGLDRIVTATP